MHPRILRLSSLAGAAATLVLAACGGGGDSETANRTPLADKWLTRAAASYQTGDFDDAQSSAAAALEASPNDPAIRTMNAKLALSHLEYARALKLTEGLQTSDAHSIRGRAHWYAGEIDEAADELEAEIRDPNVKDPWARQIATLARRGSGRHPFAMEGSLIADVEMPPAGAALVVPCELEGERILAVIATASGEVILDSNTRHDPAWVNLSFGDQAKIEVKDVPALTEDLSPLTRQLGAPVKALLGVNLLRHMHSTFDRRGDQFVVRKDDPSAPPDAARLPLWYVRGGGMLMRGTLSHDEKTTFLVDSSQPYFVALSDPMWKAAGLDQHAQSVDPSRPDVRGAPLPLMRLAGFELPQVPALSSAAITGVQSNVDLDLGGVIGASLISAFRVTFGDEGRFIWMEPDMTQQQQPPPVDGRAPISQPAPSSSQPSLTPPGANSPSLMSPGKRGGLGDPSR
ncbi:MAG: hypothetical protein ABI461_23130 [Polyangiaceae bacterium]